MRSRLLAMGNRMSRIIVAILIAFAWLDGHAQSSLPPCKADSPYWTNCFGTYTNESGTEYAGGWKDNQQYGKGSLISPKGYTFVEGFWRDDKTVDRDDLRWFWAGSSSKASVFVLSKSIKQVGAFRRAWVMWAAAEPDEKFRWLSFRQLQNFDCINERSQVLSSTEYSGSFGSGDVLSSSDEEKWGYVGPNTMHATVMKYVCNHKL